MSSYPDGGCRNHMGVAHSYCYELLTVYLLATPIQYLPFMMHFDGMALRECKVTVIWRRKGLFSITGKVVAGRITIKAKNMSMTHLFNKNPE